MTVSRAKRTHLIVEVFQDAFAPLMEVDPVAFRGGRIGVAAT